MKSAFIHVFLLFQICVFGDADKVDTVSVFQRESVTLLTGVTGIQRDELIEWKLNGYRIARISGDHSSSDGVFRDRLKLNKQTGDIKITNIKFTDSGYYTLEITSNRGSSEKKFSVIVNFACVSRQPAWLGHDPTVSSLLLSTTVNRFDGVTVAVKEGYSVVLHTDTEILRDDEIQWRFKKSVIAQMKKDEDFFSTYDDIADGRFRERLHLDHHTGNLIISNITSKTSGLYEVDVKKSTHTIHKSFNVTITGSDYVTWVVAVVLGLLLVAAAACGIYYRYRRSKLVTHSDMKCAEEVYLHKLPI